MDLSELFDANLFYNSDDVNTEIQLSAEARIDSLNSDLGISRARLSCAVVGGITMISRPII